MKWSRLLHTVVFLACGFCFLFLGGQSRDCVDNDGDGYNLRTCGSGEECGPIDCNDTDYNINPGVEESLAAGNCVDGIDNDCDNLVDYDDEEDCYCWDNDHDGYDDEACGGNDCDDSNSEISPGEYDLCDDGIDSDCDGLDCNPCTPVYDFQGGQVDLGDRIFQSVALSDGCNATPNSEFFLLNLLNWCAKSIEGGGLGLLSTLQVPGYPDFEGEESADLIIIADPINITAPMVCGGGNIITRDDVFIDESSIDCAITAWASVTITPTSDSTVDAVIRLWEVTITGIDCPVDFTPDPECIMTFDLSAGVE
ncbi:putative metal-binding motif-containing protein [Thermodesulfobacteriota bacterium]